MAPAPKKGKVTKQTKSATVSRRPDSPTEGPDGAREVPESFGGGGGASSEDPDPFADYDWVRAPPLMSPIKSPKRVKPVVAPPKAVQQVKEKPKVVAKAVKPVTAVAKVVKQGPVPSGQESALAILSLARRATKRGKESRKVEARKATSEEASDAAALRLEVTRLRAQVTALKKAKVDREGEAGLQADKLLRITASRDQEKANYEKEVSASKADQVYLSNKVIRHAKEIMDLEARLKEAGTENWKQERELALSGKKVKELEELRAKAEAQIQAQTVELKTAEERREGLEGQIQVTGDRLANLKAERMVFLEEGQGARAKVEPCQSELLWEQVHHLGTGVAPRGGRKVVNSLVQRFRDRVVKDVSLWRSEWEGKDDPASPYTAKNRGAEAKDTEPEPQRLYADVFDWRVRLDKLCSMMLNVTAATDGSGKRSVESIKDAPPRSSARIEMVGHIMPAAAAGAEGQEATDAAGVAPDGGPKPRVFPETSDREPRRVEASVPEELTKSILTSSQAMQMLVTQQEAMMGQLQAQKDQFAEVLAALKGPDTDTGLEEEMESLGKSQAEGDE